MSMQKGIELSKAYYEQYGKPMLHELFPFLEQRIAVGVFGQGSECLGLDDAFSRDHDLDPGFFLFLSAKDYKEYEFKLSRAYDKLPREFQGVKLLGLSAYGNSRHGVRETEEYFTSLTGYREAPKSVTQWLYIPEFRLLNAVNGEIFRDDLGEITEIRKGFSQMPEQVYIKKIAAVAVLMAQSGQYNYQRALHHGQRGAACLALNEFAGHAYHMLFLLNRRYTPFYKWQPALARKLPLLSGTAEKIEVLIAEPLAKDAFLQIEEISAEVITELKRQGLTDVSSEFLEPHAYSVYERITDRELKSLHIMEGL